MSEAPREPREREDVASIARRELPPFRRPGPTTYLEWTGTVQMTILLIVICSAIVAFVGIWLYTRPSLADVNALVAAQGSTKETVTAEKMTELLSKLQQEHFDAFRELFQLIVMSGLVPLFTLMAGYVFGKGQASRSKDRERGEEA